MKNTKAFRLDALEKVTGRAKFSGDFYMPGMLAAKVLWPPVASCLINKIVTKKAADLDGVVKIITASDISGPNIGGIFDVYDRPILIKEGERVRCNSDPLALVVAETEEIAAQALKLIEVDYTPIPASGTVDEAVENNDEPVFRKVIQKGDISKGFAESDHILDKVYTLPVGEHAYIEPEAGVVYRDANGLINVIVGSQDLTQNHRMICRSLGIQHNEVRVTSPYVGGAFGGKHAMSIQVYLALIGQLVDRPVRIAWTREESLAHSCKKQGFSLRVQLGFNVDGKIRALKVRMRGPAGPYHGNTPDNCSQVVANTLGSYWHDNLDIIGEMYDVMMPELGAFRGVGTPDGYFVIETMLDLAANVVGLTPLEIRQVNWIRDSKKIGECLPGSMARNYSEKWLIEEMCLTALEEADPLKVSKNPNKRVGRGLACAMAAYMSGNTGWHKGSAVDLTMFLDGSVTVRTGFAELGQGLHGIITKFTSSALDIPESMVQVTYPDTQFTGKAGALGFSQATVSIGNAIFDASEKLKNKLELLAKKCLGEVDHDIQFKAGQFYNTFDNSLALSWDDFNEYVFFNVESLTATGRFVGPDEDDGMYGVTPVACVADVEVDIETGEIKVLQIVQSHDTGKVIHHESARGQMIGGGIMEMGITMHEAFEMEGGVVLTPSFSEYLIPTSMDIPDKNVVVFHEGNLGATCPEGAKGLGEHGMHTPGAAIVNAIYDATGVMVTEVPVNGESFLRAAKRI